MAETPKRNSTAQSDQYQSIFHPIDADALDQLLEEWMNGDAAEQRETFEALREGLDENRPEGYKLFPK